VPDDPGLPGGRLAAAVAELYGAPPESFTERRGELAAAARAAGERAAAPAVGALRRPTRTAWVVNTLARTNSGAPAQLAGMAAALRDAQRAGDGRRLRELSVERDALIDGLTGQALAAAGVADGPPSLRLEVTETLTAALADPAVAADFAAGTLTRAMQWSGFGLLPADSGSAPDAGPGADAGSGVDAAVEHAVPARRRSGAGTREQAPDAAAAPRSWDGAAPVSSGAGAKTAGAARARARTAEPATAGPANAGPATAKPATGERATAKPAAAKQTAAGSAAAERRQAREAERAAGRQAAEAERAARESAERAAQRREQRAEAERTVAAASAAATEAVATEDRLEAEVRDLEERLGRARADLETARLRARRAEASERRARQALGRLPRES
jgi:hypothetical protein